jgi:hypothetical protein
MPNDGPGGSVRAQHIVGVIVKSGEAEQAKLHEQEVRLL